MGDGGKGWGKRESGVNGSEVGGAQKGKFQRMEREGGREGEREKGRGEEAEEEREESYITLPTLDFEICF